MRELVKTWRIKALKMIYVSKELTTILIDYHKTIKTIICQ